MDRPPATRNAAIRARPNPNFAGKGYSHRTTRSLAVGSIPHLFRPRRALFFKHSKHPGCNAFCRVAQFGEFFESSGCGAHPFNVHHTVCFPDDQPRGPTILDSGAFTHREGHHPMGQILIFRNCHWNSKQFADPAKRCPTANSPGYYFYSRTCLLAALHRTCRHRCRAWRMHARFTRNKSF